MRSKGGGRIPSQRSEQNDKLYEYVQVVYTEYPLFWERFLAIIEEVIDARATVPIDQCLRNPEHRKVTVQLEWISRQGQNASLVLGATPMTAFNSPSGGEDVPPCNSRPDDTNYSDLSPVTYAGGCTYKATWLHWAVS